MGSLCCCLSADHHFEDYVPYQNAAIFRECPCVRCCMRWFFNAQHYSTSFEEVDHEEDAFPSQGSTAGGAGSLGGINNLDSSSSSSLEVFQAPPQPLPYDSDPRYLRMGGGRDGLISRRDKSAMSHLGESHPLRHSNSDGGGGTALQRRFGNNGGGGGVDLEEIQSQVGLKNVLSSKAFPRVESNLSMLDDDDVCPTCLDGYTEENPRITTDCGHSFHLSCIYEWMERSNRCPLCDKEMIFSESL